MPPSATSHMSEFVEEVRLFKPINQILKDSASKLDLNHQAGLSN
jgi:hypothetical protein